MRVITTGTEGKNMTNRVPHASSPAPHRAHAPTAMLCASVFFFVVVNIYIRKITPMRPLLCSAHLLHFFFLEI